MMCVDFNCNGHQHSAAPHLFFAGFAFWLAAVLSCLQWFPFLFAAHQSFLFAAVSFFVCSVRFLFAADLFCLERSFFVAAFFVCSVSLAGHCTI